MAELDHLIYACRDVAEGVRIIEELTGATAVAGGPHVGNGTHNSLLTFDDRTYFEIIGIDPNQPEPDRPRSFGLDDLERPALVAYAIHPTGGQSLEDVAAQMSAAGVEPGTIASMSRQKPDGELLAWRLTVGGDSGTAVDGAFPFAIDWGDSPSPAVSLPSMGSLVSLTVSNPDSTVVSRIEALDVGVVAKQGPARLVATVDTPNGAVEIS